VLPEVHYRVNGGIGTLKLAPVEVAPNGVRGLELTPALAALPPGSRDLGLRKFGDSPQLVGAATGLMESDSPIGWLSPNFQRSVALSFAWRLAGEARTVLAVANPSASEEAIYHVYLQYEGGSYTWAGERRLAPGEVRHIDIRRLRDEGIEGEGGALLPPDVVAGQGKVMVRNRLGEKRKLVSQAIQIDGEGRMTGFLSCAYCPPDPSDLTLSPLSLTGEVGTSQQIYPWIWWSDGTSNINNNPNAIDWYPANPVIATVLEAWGNFQVQFHSPGTTLLDATMPNECAWEYDDSAGDCNCAFYLQVSTQVPAQVTATCATPVNFRTTNISKLSDGTLRFDYSWDSSTGQAQDLASCVVGETVFYPNYPNTSYTWPLPMVQTTVNPTIIDGPGSTLGFIDFNYPPGSYRAPYSSASFQATQRLRWSCPCFQGGQQQNFVPDITITRSVFKDTEGKWKYRIVKSGQTNTIVLPNQ